MATDKSTSSVLAKLMGLDKLLPPRKIHGRRRVFSEHYFRNDSSVIDMDKLMLDARTNVMDVSDYEDCEETVVFSEGASVDYCDFDLITSSGDSRTKSKWNDVMSSPKTQSFDQCEGLDQRGRTRSYMSLGHLAVQSSCGALEDGKHKSIEARSRERRSCHTVDSGFFSGSTNKKQKTVLGVRNRGSGLQERRIGHNSMKSKVREKVSPREIAKQITNEVNHSVWHSCVKASRSEGRVDKSDLEEYVRKLPSVACLIDSESKFEVSSSDPSKRFASINTQKTKKTRLESWKKRKYSQEVRTCRGIKTVDQMHVVGIRRNNSVLNCEDVYSCSFVSTSARFLSSPTFFPSAWVPRSKERRFTLDRSWCSRPTTVEEAKTYDTVFSSAESSTYHRTGKILNVKVNNHVGNHSSNEISLVAVHSTFDSTPTSVKTEKVTLDEKMGMSSKLHGEILPFMSCKSISFDDASPSQKEFVQKHELKSTTSPPGSPVSSLEGPEACRRCLNFTVKSKEVSLPRCLDEDALGLPTTFHWIEAVSTESGSEGPGMVVSSDASDGGGSTGCYREDTQIAECTSESCDFSYLIDVLTESGMMTGNLEMESVRWCFGRFVLDPSVFDFLEKKYGKSTVREKSERKLFFDRINYGLDEILRPSAGINSWRKPVVKRLSVRRNQEFIEEELWALLVNQEEFNRDLSGNVYGQDLEWLDLEEDVGFIAEEMQCLLMDELVEEFLSVEMLCR